jgi:hypothetical protein
MPPETSPLSDHPLHHPPVRLGRFLAACLVALALLAGVADLVVTSDSEAAPSADEQYFIDQINGLRQSLGLQPLLVDDNMASLAAAHTESMIASGQLVHAADLSVGVSGPWSRLGENIGRASDAPLLWTTFVNSPGHYANLTNPAFTHVGVAVGYDAGGQLWTTHRFVARPGGVEASEPPPAPAPPPARPAPRPRTVNPPVRAPEPPPEPPPPPPPPLPKPEPGRVAAVLDVLRASPA